MCHDLTIHYMCPVCGNRWNFEKHGLMCRKANETRSRLFASCGNEYPVTLWNQEEICEGCLARDQLHPPLEVVITRR